MTISKNIIIYYFYLLLIIICSSPIYVFANAYMTSNFACSLSNGRVIFTTWKSDGLKIVWFSWTSDIHGFTKFWNTLYFWINHIEQSWRYIDSYLYSYSCKYRTVKQISFTYKNDKSLDSEIFLDPTKIPGIYIVWSIVWWESSSLWVFNSQKNQYFPIFETEQFLDLISSCETWDCHFELNKRKWNIYMKWFDWKGGKKIFLVDLAGLKLIPQ